MEKEKKLTKKEVLLGIRTFINGEDTDVTLEDMVDYIDTTLAQLDKKAEKAAERAAKNKAEGDELRAKVFALVTDTPQTADEITASLGDAEVSKAKVVARLTQLVKSEQVKKEETKIGDSRKMVYSLAQWV